MRIKRVTDKDKMKNKKSRGSIGIRQKSIKFRLTVAYVSLLLISIILISASVYIILKNSISSKVTNYSENIIEQVSFNTRSKFNNVESIYVNMENAGILADLENRDTATDNFDKITLTQSLNNKLTSQSTFNAAIVTLAMVDETKTAIGITPTIFNDDQSILDKMINLAKTDVDKFHWINYIVSRKNDSNAHILVVKAMLSKASKEYLGILIMEVSSAGITNAYNGVNLGTNSKIFTMDNSGDLVGENIKLENSYLDKAFMKKIVDNDNKNKKSFEFNVNGKNTLIIFSKIVETDIYNIATLPVSNFSSDSNSMIFFMLFIGIICFTISLVGGFIVEKSITIPLKKFVEYIKVVGKGDFTYRLEDSYKDEISTINESFNEMLIKVAQLIGAVKDMSLKINVSTGEIDELAKHSNSASEQVAITMGEISSGTKEQAEEVSRGVTIMEKLALGIQDITDKISETSTIIDKSKSDIGGSIETIKTLNDKSEETNQFSQEIINEVNELNNDMKEIKEITDIIMRISGQTTLLSLNAAIEASRAGEAGRGFSVIADEVRKLAIQSKNASLKINNIINEVNIKTEHTVEEANNSKEIVEEQKEAVNNTNQAFIAMRTAMQGVNIKIDNMKIAVINILKIKDITLDTIEGIAAVSEETSACTEQVLNSTQQQIAGMQSLNERIVQLSNLSKKLNYSIEKFKLD